MKTAFSVRFLSMLGVNYFLCEAAIDAGYSMGHQLALILGISLLVAVSQVAHHDYVMALKDALK